MQPELPLSRRRLLQLLATSSGSLAVAAFVPQKWVRPLVEVGYLPAHAQGSATPAPTSTQKAATNTPNATSTAPANTATSSPNTPTATSTTPTNTPTATSTTTNFTLSGLSRTVTALNGCTGPDGSSGSLFEIKFNYQHPSGGVTNAIRITQLTRFSPSNREATFQVTNFTVTGNGSSGTISYTVCTGFGSDTQVTTQVTVTDANGLVSNTLSATFDKPVGANEVSPTAYETP